MVEGVGNITYVCGGVYIYIYIYIYTLTIIIILKKKGEINIGDEACVVLAYVTINSLRLHWRETNSHQAHKYIFFFVVITHSKTAQDCLISDVLHKALVLYSNREIDR